MKSDPARKARLFLASLALMAPAGLAHGQAMIAQFNDAAARDGDFFRGQAVSVLERPHPDYAPVPKPFGALNAYPTLGAELEATDNLLATPQGDGDVVGHLTPGVNLLSDWSRNSLQVFARADLAGYAQNSSKDAVTGVVGFNTRRDISRGDALQFGASVARETEDPTSPGATVGLTEPVEFDHAAAYGGGSWTFNRLRLMASGDYDGRRFSDSRSALGPVKLDFRDVDLFEGALRGEYAVSPSLSAFVSVTGNTRNALVILPTQPDRDSTGYTVEGGVNFESGALWRGEIGLGYLSQNFKNAFYSDVDGLSVHARVEYFPTQLTNLRFTAERGVNEPGIAIASGYLFTRGSAEIDHELLRNLILVGQLTREESDYVGVDRDDRAWSANFRANYLINRSIAVYASLRHFNRSSHGTAAARSFDVNSANLGLTYRF